MMNMSNGGNNFDRAVVMAAVAQICESVGFQGFQNFALERLSDVALRYIHGAGETAHSCANLAGRRHCNAFDIVQGLDDLRLGLGFGDASGLGHRLTSSETVRDIITYISQAEDVPFAYSIKGFPVLRERELAPSFLQIGEEPPDEHIPPWLPAFPGSPSYTKKLKEFGGETKGIWRSGRNRNGLKREDNLWQKHFETGRLEQLSSVNKYELTGAMRAAECNPFLVVPLRFDDREMSNFAEFSVETKKSSGFLKNFIEDHVRHDLFDPGVEVAGSELCHFKQRKKKDFFVDRPPIKFKLGITRKSLVSALNSSLRNQDLQMDSPCCLEQYEKDAVDAMK